MRHDDMLPVDHLASPDHEEAAVPDVGGVQLEVRVGEHHQAGRAGPNHLRLALLHLTETLAREKCYYYNGVPDKKSIQKYIGTLSI